MERLRDAIAKARATREDEAAAPARRRGARVVVAHRAVPDSWNALKRVTLDESWLANERIVSLNKSDSAHVAFDVLRTRLLRVLSENGWRKVLITSPTKGCGKSTVAVNLAISLARQAAARTLLIDLDMKTPRIARRLGLERVSLPVADWLTSEEPLHSHFMKIGDNLAVCLNTKPSQNSAELLHDPRTTERLEAAIGELDPAAVIYDMPPVLVSDDALGFLPQVDCVLLVAEAGTTRAEQIEECERLFDGNTNFLGVVLNKCELPPGDTYRYYDDGSEYHEDELKAEH